MAATSYRGRCGGGRDHTHSSSLRRSISPSGGLRCRSASAFASSSASAFSPSSPRSSALLHRSASPTWVIFAGPSPSPRRRLQRWRRPEKDVHVLPDDSPGFVPLQTPQGHRWAGHRRRVVILLVASIRLNARPSAMTNSLVRIGAVEGEWVRRSLAALTRPSSHQQRRGAAFEPRPSRLSFMSKADDDDPR
ncbi:hypothetical protein C4D60_Mb03t22080 [Musa balbisiana]|uniref:Uncharacterized protein n=1 Tax=Musa balbisiana TaxID=52838 RepID=A0A4S8JBT3_MUSBA|nr:hypothetical protein C4D60_Mb03t22080 [Musa balbisiana]